MQLIKMMSDIFKKANIPLQLRTYEIIITSKNSGLIEFISDSISIDVLKRKTYTDLNTFYRNFFERGPKKFCRIISWLFFSFIFIKFKR